MGVWIRPVGSQDVPVIREVQRLSGDRFWEVGLGDVAISEPMSREQYETYANAGRAWAAADEATGVVGFVLVDEIDRAAHVEQVSVIPDRQGQGIGRALIEHVEAWAIRRGLKGLTLTTFDHVPWNRPLYEHLGFRVLAEGEMSPGLRAIRATEAAHGLDPALRVAMFLSLLDGQEGE